MQLKSQCFSKGGKHYIKKLFQWFCSEQEALYVSSSEENKNHSTTWNGIVVLSWLQEGTKNGNLYACVHSRYIGGAVIV